MTLNELEETVKTVKESKTLFETMLSEIQEGKVKIVNEDGSINEAHTECNIEFYKAAIQQYDDFLNGALNI